MTVFSHPVLAILSSKKIPFQLELFISGNLLGLIELQVRNVTFGMSKIDLNQTKKFDINILKNFKMKSESEVIKIYEKITILLMVVLKKVLNKIFNYIHSSYSHLPPHFFRPKPNFAFLQFYRR
jgi:hypothetical protein